MDKVLFLDKWLALLIIAIMAGVAFGVYLYWSSEVATYEITGTVKDVALVPIDNKGGTTYVVYLNDGRTLELKRNFWHSGLNEDKLYFQLKDNVNKTYVFSCWGWQYDGYFLIWNLYWYPNVYEMKQV